MQRPSALAIRNLTDLTKKGERMSSLTPHRGCLRAILIVALVWGGSFVSAQAASADATAFPSDPPTIHASPISGPIVLDGKFSEEAWANCVEVSDLATTAGGLPANAVSMRVGLPLPQGLTLQTTSDEVTYTSAWLKVSFSLRKPTMTFLSVDATGESRHSSNLLKAPIGGGPAIVTPNGISATVLPPCIVTVNGNVVHYAEIKLGPSESTSLSFSDPAKVDRHQHRQRCPARLPGI